MSPLPCVEPHSERPARLRSGLSLLELVVALGILAVASTMAVRALDPIADQARYESTQRTLEQLRDATLGDRRARNSNGQRIVSGYIADTGVLPATLDDLLVQPVSLIAHASQSFDSDRDSINDVTLTSGWRGPYLLLGAGHSTLLDGWGRAPLIDPDGGDFDFTSLGSDNNSVLPEDGYQADITVPIPATEYASSATFRLFGIAAGTGLRIDPVVPFQGQLAVLFYGVNANGGTTGAVEERLIPVASTGSFETTLNNLPHGCAAARGILWIDSNADQVIDALETIDSISYVHYFTITGEADLRIEMDLR
jgi:prepilin-type N-terminal cleavage/methylation domain-containing protein